MKRTVASRKVSTCRYPEAPEQLFCAPPSKFRSAADLETDGSRLDSESSQLKMLSERNRSRDIHSLVNLFWRFWVRGVRCKRTGVPETPECNVETDFETQRLSTLCLEEIKSECFSG